MSTIKTNTITDVAGSGGPTLTNGATFGTAAFAAPSGTAPIYACRAWVNFNGTGTVAIRASGNVSSITDNGVGNYTVNFTAAMPDANYSYQCNGSNATRVLCVGPNDTNRPTASALRVYCYPGANTSTVDSTDVTVAISR